MQEVAELTEYLRQTEDHFAARFDKLRAAEERLRRFEQEGDTDKAYLLRNNIYSFRLKLWNDDLPFRRLAALQALLALDDLRLHAQSHPVARGDATLALRS